MSGPAYIAEMPSSPETSKRWWSMYCRECGIEEMMARNADDPALVERRDEHNARIHPDLRHQFQEFTDTTQRWHDGEEVTPGDCWRACLASLLEVPLAEVPHFIHLFPDTPPADPAEAESERRLTEMLGARWWRESVAWVQYHRPGWTLACWDRPEVWTPIWHRDMYESGLLDRREILTAPSPRGDWMHSVIVDAVTGELVHDPFPGGQGVLPGPGDRVALVRTNWLGGDRG